MKESYMKIDFKEVLNCANEYKPAISKFLRDMIAIPSVSRQQTALRLEEMNVNLFRNRITILNLSG
jgi:hypothetical protein